MGEGIKPLRTVADLNIGESIKLKLTDGDSVEVTLLDTEAVFDKLRNAVRSARAKVSVNGHEVWLDVANYNLPVTVGNVQIDCPVIKAYSAKSSHLRWGLKKEARLRVWPAGSPYITPGTFVYPIKQRLFASDTQMGNEPAYVDGTEDPVNPDYSSVYYHSALDFGGSEGKEEIVSSVDGLVITSGVYTIDGARDLPDKGSYDAVYVLDKRGWYHGFFHLFSIDSAIKPGVNVKMGQKIGTIGKEGESGGWVHLHYVIKCRQPSGEWGDEYAYPFIWEAYRNQYNPAIIAVARPHQLVPVGKVVVLDGRKSKSFEGEITLYEWLFTDGSKASGALQERNYEKPGTYSEVLKAVDSKGNIDYDYAVIQVIDPNDPSALPPTIHASYYPTTGIRAGDPVSFVVRTFRINDEGSEKWNFGDDSPVVEVKSELPENSVKGKYAETIHRFEKPGHYIVRVERTGNNGYKAIASLHVQVFSK
ncbi:MAG: hypothetical protein A2W90_21960 [Bacteroidetes bacterium GWF2_42_66]|nr:MAG: hypothetical protein A2W92_04775 [Bacteroidetes bacterium GWA2_42_15]OFY03247.1 MAG: hypothetical protein A2W89_18900 [Bacteroidetes bacterium GWE2_42_39]OFY45703.1 MAG: hypothetical protein A2W90_21960 [Bacteroidetes bacterium GWF2_42_66]